ncbi:hypothetical protein Peur_030341 [Populus x canadensis]
MKPQSCMIHPVPHQVNGTPTNRRKFEEKKIEVAEATSKQVGETNKALEDLRRVNKLLADVRSELISSQKSLTFSRKQMEEQEQILKGQLPELEERRKRIMSYMTSLTDAKIEARNKELERELSTEKELLTTEKELLEELQKELEKERLSLEQAIERFFYSRNRIRKILNLGDEVNQEVAELKTLISSNEELVRAAAATTLKDKEEHVQIMQDELNNTRSSRVKEMEVLAAQRAPTIKYEEFKIVPERLDTKEKELKNSKEAAVEDANDPRKLYSLARERIGERSIRNLAIKKLKLEAVQLEVEAATGDPQKLAETSRELLKKANLSIEANADSSTSMKKGSDPDLVLLEDSYVSKRLKQSHSC